MAFKFITGPGGTDKTAKCIDMLKRCLGSYKHIYYVVPEYLSYSAEKQISAEFGVVSDAKVNVTSFKKLYCETVNVTGERHTKKLTAGGVRVLMAYICLKNKQNLKMIGKSAHSPGFAEIMTNAVREFKTYNVSPEDLTAAAEKISDSFKLKLDDIAKIYTEYTNYLAEGFSDAQDELSILETAIRENPGLYAGSLFVFDGFTMFTPDQLNVISALSEKSDLAFSFTTDETTEDTYKTQKNSIRKIRSVLSGAEEKPLEKAEYGQRFDAFPEGRYILETLLYGKNVKYDKKPENVEIYEFAEQYQETEFVAEKIIELIKNGARYKDVMIVARDSDRYLPVIASVFKDYEIPVFIDKKLGAVNQPAINAVLSALSVLQENFSYESVFSYLKTGFSNLSEFETDLIENYIIATGIRGKSWMKKWEYTPYISELFGDKEQFLENINSIREKVLCPLLNLKNKLDEHGTILGKTTALFEFIKEINLYGKIAGMVQRFKKTDPQTAAYCGRVWNLLLKSMDELVELLGEKEERTEMFINLFALGLSMHEISIVPINTDVVQVVTPENISEKPEKYVFVMGANDGVYPSVMQNEGLLSDRDRSVLGGLGIELAQDTLSKALEENYITVKTFLSAYGKIFISYPVGDAAGGARFAAVPVKRIKSVFPELEIKTEVVSPGMYGDDKIIKPKPAFSKYAANLRSGEKISEKWSKAGAWYRRNPQWQDRFNMLKKAVDFRPSTKELDKNVVDKLYEKGLNLSVSSMERYAKCPFSYYATYILNLKTRERVDFSSADTGTLMHEAIEKLSGSIIKNGYTWKSSPRDFLEREIIRISDEIIIALESKFDSASLSQKRKLARMKDLLEQSVMYIADHLRAGEFEPLGYEIQFGTGKNYEAVTFEMFGKKIRLRGKVDRADIFCDDAGRKYIRVIDYKSGDKSFDFSAMLYGLQMQLVVYLDRLCEETGAEPAGILYFRLFDPVVEAAQNSPETKIQELITKQHKMSGVVVDNPDIIRAMDSSVGSDSKVIPVRFKKGGDIDARSSVLTSEQFNHMQKHINRLIRKVGKEILEGKTDISPSHFGNTTGCDYCDFKKICLFDEHCGGHFKEFEALGKDEVLNLIKKAGEDDETQAN